MVTILEKKELAPKCWQFVLQAPLIARKAKAGQFVVLRVDESGERIPLTIANKNPEAGTITIVFQEVGQTTAKLAKLEEGGQISNLLGPLGHPTEIKHYGTVVCIGGGIGAAPIYPIISAMREQDNQVIAIIGARSRNFLIMEKEIREKSSQMIVTTDDGSYGHHGFVTDELKRMIELGMHIDLVVAIGPVVMMQAVCGVTKKYGIKTLVSLNPIMVDATGMCGACRVSVGGQTKFTCVDGPEFDGHEVDFDLLRRRQAMYQPEEKQANEAYRQKCERCK